MCTDRPGGGGEDTRAGLGLQQTATRGIRLPIFEPMPNNAQEQGAALIRSVIHQARTFLREMGEFYPFGAVVNAEGHLQPYALHAEGDALDAMKLRKELWRLLDEDMLHGSILGYATGVNVRARKPGTQQIVDAVEIKLCHKDLDATAYFMEYEGQGSDMRFFELFEGAPDLDR